MTRRMARALGHVRGRAAAEVAADEALEWRCLQTGPSPTPRRLRILYTAMRYDYGDPTRGLSYEEHAFYHSLFMLGHELIRFDPIVMAGRFGRETASRMLRQAVVRYQPDLMFTVLFRDELDRAVMHEISTQTSTVTFNWFADDHWRYDAFSRRWAPCFTWVGTTSAAALERYRRDGVANVILTQWACNPYLYQPIPTPRSIDVSFVGQPHGNRREVIETLRRRGIAVSTFGLGWPSGRVAQDEMIRIFNRSKINLNLSNASRGGADQVKGRDFEVPGCRGFLLTKASAEIGRYFDVGREIVCYDAIDELAEKIRFYLAHDAEREAIAAAGYRRTMAEHTYAHRFGVLFDSMRMSGASVRV